MPDRDILGINVASISKVNALAFVYDKIARKIFMPIAYLNAHCVNVALKNKDYRHVLSTMTVFPDGVGVDIASKILHGQKFLTNLNGTDFIPIVLTSAPAPLKVALYGAAPGIAQKAAKKLSTMDPRHTIRVVGHGFINEYEQTKMCVSLTRFKPDVLLVALGVPYQELWINEHINQEHCTTVFGVGALFDFLAGNIKRAPGWVRKLKLEWGYRLLQEPGRMWHRYIIGNPLFIFHVLQYRFFAGQRGQNRNDKN